MPSLVSEDVVFTTSTLVVVKTRRINKDSGQILCDNGQWYTFIDFVNDWNDDGLYLPEDGLRVRIQFDKFSNPVNWRQW